MHSIQFDKHRLINGFPESVRDQCLREYEKARQEHWHHKTSGRPDVETQPDTRSEQQKYRDARAEAIWDDEAQKAAWDYDRQGESDRG